MKLQLNQPTQQSYCFMFVKLHFSIKKVCYKTKLCVITF